MLKWLMVGRERGGEVTITDDPFAVLNIHRGNKKSNEVYSVNRRNPLFSGDHSLEEVTIEIETDKSDGFKRSQEEKSARSSEDGYDSPDYSNPTDSTSGYASHSARVAGPHDKDLADNDLGGKGGLTAFGLSEILKGSRTAEVVNLPGDIILSVKSSVSEKSSSFGNVQFHRRGSQNRNSVSDDENFSSREQSMEKEDKPRSRRKFSTNKTDLSIPRWRSESSLTSRPQNKNQHDSSSDSDHIPPDSLEVNNIRLMTGHSPRHHQPRKHDLDRCQHAVDTSRKHRSRRRRQSEGSGEDNGADPGFSYNLKKSLSTASSRAKRFNRGNPDPDQSRWNDLNNEVAAHVTRLVPPEQVNRFMTSHHVPLEPTVIDLSVERRAGRAASDDDAKGVPTDNRSSRARVSIESEIPRVPETEKPDSHVRATYKNIAVGMSVGQEISVYESSDEEDRKGGQRHSDGERYRRDSIDGDLDDSEEDRGGTFRIGSDLKHFSSQLEVCSHCGEREVDIDCAAGNQAGSTHVHLWETINRFNRSGRPTFFNGQLWTPKQQLQPLGMSDGEPLGVVGGYPFVVSRPAHDDDDNLSNASGFTMDHVASLLYEKYRNRRRRTRFFTRLLFILVLTVVFISVIVITSMVLTNGRNHFGPM